ncbi:hypothetical protein EIP91_009648, partial [Steccherinum ochraceum]
MADSEVVAAASFAKRCGHPGPLAGSERAGTKGLRTTVDRDPQIVSQILDLHSIKRTL